MNQKLHRHYEWYHESVVFVSELQDVQYLSDEFLSSLVPQTKRRIDFRDLQEFSATKLLIAGPT